jgi:hypothetical protein
MSLLARDNPLDCMKLSQTWNLVPPWPRSIRNSNPNFASCYPCPSTRGHLRKVRPAWSSHFLQSEPARLCPCNSAPGAFAPAAVHPPNAVATTNPATNPPANPATPVSLAFMLFSLASTPQISVTPHIFWFLEVSVRLNCEAYDATCGFSLLHPVERTVKSARFVLPTLITRKPVKLDRL